jgi:sulfotransferase family protein
MNATTSDLGFSVICVGGAMRTGTSLLQNVLSSSPDANDMSVECQYLTDQLKLHVKWVRQNERALTDFFEGKDGLIDFTRKLVVEFLKQTHIQQGTPKNLILKHPEMTPFFPLLANLLPDARFIISVRDPKDIVASMLVVAAKQKELGRTSNMRQAGRDMARLTNLALSFYQNLNTMPKTDPLRHRFIRYEDLVKTPDQLVPQIAAFTGLDLSSYDPAAPWRYTRPRGTNKVFDTKIRGKGLQDSSIGNYRQQLSEAEIFEVEKTATRFLDVFHYPRVSQP